MVKAIKVRVRDGKSADVQDFNLYLTPNDVWASAPVPPCLHCGKPKSLHRERDQRCPSGGAIEVRRVWRPAHWGTTKYRARSDVHPKVHGSET